MNLNVLSKIGYILLVIAIVYLWRIDSLFGNGYLSLSLQIAAGLLMIWARIAFGFRSFHAGANPTPGGLIRTGPYRYIRHPIYASVLLFIFTGVTANSSWAGFLTGLVTAVSVITRILCEEKLLVERYPEYAEYAGNTKRLIPFIY